jgi:hypothetical protein
MFRKITLMIHKARFMDMNTASWVMSMTAMDENESFMAMIMPYWIQVIASLNKNNIHWVPDRTHCPLGGVNRYEKMECFTSFRISE